MATVTYRIFLHAFPIFIMIGLIPIVRDDVLLAFLFLGFSAISLLRRWSSDIVFFLFGFIASAGFESLFVATGIEEFGRTSFFGVMPLWLPFLWGYVFIALRRIVPLLDGYLKGR